MRSAPLAAAIWLAAMATAALASGEPRRSTTSRPGANALPGSGPNGRARRAATGGPKFAAAIVAVLEEADSQKLSPADLQASVLKELNLDAGEEEEIAAAYAAALEELERKGVIKYNGAGTRIKLEDDRDDEKDKGESGGSKRDDDDEDSKDGGKDDDEDQEDSPDYQLEPEDGTDPTAGTGPDSDQDGVADAAEDAAGTDPTDPDSDRDGATDGQEAGAGTDGLDPADTPAVGDQDGENVGDALEEIMGTDPADPDTDNDGARCVGFLLRLFPPCFFFFLICCQLWFSRKLFVFYFNSLLPFLYFYIPATLRSSRPGPTGPTPPTPRPSPMAMGMASAMPWTRPSARSPGPVVAPTEGPVVAAAAAEVLSVTSSATLSAT